MSFQSAGDQDEAYMDQSFNNRLSGSLLDEEPRVRTITGELTEEDDDFSMKENYDQVNESHMLAKQPDEDSFPILKITSLGN